MRIYLSGPITGHPDFKDKFEHAQKTLEAAGHEVVNPALLDTIMPPTATHSDYMKICIPLENVCDTIYMLEGWKESKGAMMEFEYAYNTGLTIIFEGGRK